MDRNAQLRNKRMLIMEHAQPYCFERKVGQEVYATVRPSHGPFANKLLGYRRGVIQHVGPYKENPKITICKVLFDVDVGWYSAKPVVVPIPQGHPEGGYHPRISRYFDYGVWNKFEIDILCQGGLITSDPVRDGGYFAEPQSAHLVEEIMPAVRELHKHFGEPWVANPLIDTKKLLAEWHTKKVA